jgi:hypothetical protein
MGIDIYQGRFLTFVIHASHGDKYFAFMKMKASKAGFSRLALPVVLIITVTATVCAQDPVLPPTNLGLASVYDGMAGKPGFVYQGFFQAFATRAYYDQDGKRTPTDIKINSVLLMNQVLYLSPVKVLGGNVGFTVLVPIVQISSSSASGAAPTTNTGALGDPIAGVAVQWSDKQLFGKPYSHRLEFDLGIPLGNFDSRYAINPSAHLWSYEMYYALTIILNKKISISSRNELNYNSDIIGSEAKPGAFYNGSYSIDYSILPSVKIEAVSYYLKQLVQDSYDGDHHYYQDRFGIKDTKERVFAYGPGLAFFSPRGIIFEGKVFFETDGQNRFVGTRNSLRVAIPLSK